MVLSMLYINLAKIAPASVGAQFPEALTRSALAGFRGGYAGKTGGRFKNAVIYGILGPWSPPFFELVFKDSKQLMLKWLTARVSLNHAKTTVVCFSAFETGSD